ncbi:rifampicin phosphotransferase-like [Euwallacea fornicatus]|uniref:rifampicin phosphotransferase-like n=1 Tax=Euwallacea fornicatus TaxID=995702 RepID=UPI00338F554D
MDLFSVLSMQLILLLPVVIYLLFFKRNNGRSVYSGRDIFYPIKYFLANRVVKAVQQKSRKGREKVRHNHVEPGINFTSQKSFHYQSFVGCDQKGNSLKLKLILRPCKIAETILVLRLSNGAVYTFPSHQHIHTTSLKDYKWKINGLSIETLEPYKRVRMVFNGLLRNISERHCEKTEHVQFSFIFNACSAPKFFPEDCDSGLLTETLATRPWKDASWKKFLTDHPDGFDQFGALLGVVKGDSFAEEQILNLAACRTRYRSNEERFLLDREVQVFLTETNGMLIHLTLQSFQDQKSQLNYGYVFHKNQRTDPITAQDVRIDNVASSKAVPEFVMGHINAKSSQYSVAFYLSKSSTLFQTSIVNGYELGSAFAECNVNNSRGKALLEFKYCDQRNEVSPPKLQPVLSERKCDHLPDEYVVNIKNTNAQILGLTGGKGNSLALLRSLSAREFSVPDGFILTVNAFNRQVAGSKLLQEALASIETAFCGCTDLKREDVCDLAVRLFSNEPVHPDIAHHIVLNLRDVIRSSSEDEIDVVSWAVRSSAIGEDSEELSAAGQNETILGCVTETEVLKAVARCWASLFTFQSVKYRWQHGIPIKSEMAVVIQKMVPADVAGVLFTWHPTTSNPSQMVVTSNFGLGESVVSGLSDPDTFILKRTYDGKVDLVDQTIGTKNKVFTLTARGVQEVTINQEDKFVFINEKSAKQQWSLTKDQVLTLGKVGVALEQAFGSPQDIEWAFYKGRLYLLQSRPITTLSTWTDFELTHELDAAIVTETSLFTVANAGEVFPKAMSALSRTTTLIAIDVGMQACTKSCDVERDFLRAMSVVSNRVFIDCIYVMYMNFSSEEIPMIARVMDLAIFGHSVINAKITRMVKSRLPKTSLLRSLKELQNMWSVSQNLNRIVANTKEKTKNVDFGIKGNETAEEIYHKIIGNDFNLLKLGYNHSLTSQVAVFWQIVCMMILIGKEKEIKPENYADFANILSSCEGVESVEVPLYLQKITGIIRDEGYSEEFCTIKPEFGVNWLQAKCPAAYKVFVEFLRKHGHRCIGEIDFTSETWDMNPCQVIVMLQANAKHMQTSKKVDKSVSQVISELASPISTIGREILRYSLTKLRVAVGTREQSKSAFILGVHKLRLAYKQLASAMVQQGFLPSENLIFHLTEYELRELLKGSNPALVSKAIRREKLYPKWNNLRFPELNYGFPQPEGDFDIPAEFIPDTKCVGTSVCTGNVQGRACVIRHLDQIGILEKGDILITYSTDIGWSPYFPMLAGIVTEIGGLVSHGAVVAREYGLPCIVGVKNATKLFKTGDIVALSGKTGELGKV